VYQVDDDQAEVLPPKAPMQLATAPSWVLSGMWLELP
jgi:hypothetical protein